MSAEPHPKVLDLVQALEDSLVKARAAATIRLPCDGSPDCLAHPGAPWDHEDDRTPITPISSTEEAP